LITQKKGRAVTAKVFVIHTIELHHDVRGDFEKFFLEEFSPQRPVLPPARPIFANYSIRSKDRKFLPKEDSLTGPIYKLFLFRNTEAYYQLPEEERNAALAKLDAAFQKVGGKRLIMCDSSWSSEQWPVFGVEEFPNIEAVQEYAEALRELNLARYVESMTVLGTELQ
jgi:hypothetical protein